MASNFHPGPRLCLTMRVAFHTVRLAMPRLAPASSACRFASSDDACGFAQPLDDFLRACLLRFIA